MPDRRIYDSERFAHFVTFSCYRRRRLLDHDRSKRIVVAALAAQLRQQDGVCAGFVIMPEHVHAIVWFPQPNELSFFMKQWKHNSSVQIKKLFTSDLKNYAINISHEEAIWQAKYYPFHIYNHEKLVEKLEYMHLNPVKRGLVEYACDWRFSSARWYEQRRTVGVPILCLE